jgi:hypothetical protein
VSVVRNHPRSKASQPSTVDPVAQNEGDPMTVGPSLNIAFCYEQTSSRPKSTSALPPKADILVADTDFRF